ncbi:long-chain fatty acid--CoA ligase [Streptomyces racemochromogenes]|uniref:Long-chain fatty acid--CoA ligase n=1 Tax=Streptomyces racemochromogenes TaxID=67353 RepID=A0ABW7PF74_9ACTN
MSSPSPVSPPSSSVASVLAESAARRPAHPALVFGERSYSYAELWDGALRYAAALRERGLGAGDRVALLLPNTPAFPMAYYGVLALGCTAVPVHEHSRAPEIAHVLRDSGAVALVCAASLLPGGTAGARAAGVALLGVHDGDGDADGCDGDGGGRDVSAELPRLDREAERARPLDGLVPRAPEDIAVVLYTSGTTGAPKGVMLTHHSVLMNITTTARTPFAFDGDDVLLGTLPLSHTFGQICGMGVCFHAGATLVLMSRFCGTRALDLMAAHGCTVVMGVPTMYLALLDAAGRDPRRPPLDRAYSGGSSLPPAVLRRVEEVLGAPVYEGYGLTETSPSVSYNQPGIPRRPGTVGLPIPGVEVGIAAPDEARRIRLLPDGERGEIVVRGHGLMAGYLNRPEATAEVLVDGWLRTGDIGLREEDGYLRVVDRKKDVVIRGGYNVYPREVEEVLLGHPSVAQAAVVGVPHDRLGEEVCAVLRTVPGVRPDPRLAEEITVWSGERLARYKYPRRIVFTEAFPVGPTGKILKAELAGFFR